MYLWLGGARDSSLSPLTQSPGPGAAVSAPSLIQWAKSTWSCCHRPGIWRGLGVLWQSQSLLLCSLEPMAVSHPAWAPDIRCTGWLCRCGPHGFLASGDFLLHVLILLLLYFVWHLWGPILLLDLEVYSHFQLSDWFLNNSSLLIEKSRGSKTGSFFYIWKYFRWLDVTSLLFTYSSVSFSGFLPWLCCWQRIPMRC